MRDLLPLASARNLRLALIVVPWLLAALYLTVLAEDRYVSESVVALRQSGQGPVSFDSLSALFGSAAPATREDETMLEAHILSLDMMRALDEKFGLRAHYSAPALDLVFRLSPRATQEDVLRYYQRRVEVVLDGRSGLMTLRTQGFSPEFAEQINREIIASSERFINESSHRLAREQMAFAEQQMAIAREAVDEARAQVFEFQTRYGVLDPTAQAVANTGLTAELQATLARQEAELKVALGYLNEDSHQVKALRTQIAGLRGQLDTESQRAITNPRGKSLNVLAGEYQELLARLQFAQDTYRIALTGLETARIESTRKIKSLVLVESPARPESAGQPRRIYTLIVLLLGLTILYGIMRLVVATIEDHRE